MLSLLFDPVWTLLSQDQPSTKPPQIGLISSIALIIVSSRSPVNEYIDYQKSCMATILATNIFLFLHIGAFKWVLVSLSPIVQIQNILTHVMEAQKGICKLKTIQHIRDI